MATTIQSTVNSTSPSTGALVTLGGVGIAKDLFVGGSLSIEGDVHITGVVTNDPLNRLVTKQKLLENEVGNLSNELAALARAQEYNDLILETAELSAANSATSALTAAQSKIDAVNAMNDAIQAKIDAVAKAGEAAGSASQSATSATNAANSATGAGNSATAAQTSANSAGTYATNAGNSAALAQSKADLAAASESAAGNSATAAANSASSASTSAGNAATSAAASVQSYNKLSAKIDLIESNFGAASANLTDNLLVLVDANSQTAQHLEKLESNFTANNISTNATISNLATTVTTGDSANATSISNLTATVNTKNRTFKQGTAPTASAVGDMWIDTSNGNIVKYWDGSSWTESSDTRIATNAAAITTEATARANGDSANASSITTLSTTVGGHTTSISTLTSTTNGLNARWGVTVNNNGSISGIVLNSTGASNGGTPTTAVVIAADKFALVEPTTNYTSGNTPPTASVPFEVVGGVTYIKSASIANIIQSGSWNGTNAGWQINRNGNIVTYGTLEVRDTSGNIVLSTAGNMDFNRVVGSTKPENNATVGANGSNLSISNSGNMLPNSDFVTNPLTNNSWVVSWNAGGGTNYTLAWDLASSYWAPAGGHTIGVVRDSNIQAASSWFDIMYDKYIPMQAGITFELSGYLAAHRCGVELHIAYYNSSYAYISESGWGTTTPPSGGNDLNNWYRAGGIATTPANTAYVRIFVRGSAVDAGQTQPYYWATKLFFGLTKSGQTQLSPWSAATASGAFAELNQINSSNIGVYMASAAISDAYITNLNASKIIAKTLTANKIVNNSLSTYTPYYASTGSACSNGIFTSIASFSKTFTHRDANDDLMVSMVGACDSGTTAVRVIGFYITGNAYYWYSGWNEYRAFGSSVNAAIALEAQILSYTATADCGHRAVTTILQKKMRYLPTYNHTTDYDVNYGNIIITGTCTFHFCISQSSGASKTPTEVSFTVMDTYA